MFFYFLDGFFRGMFKLFRSSNVSTENHAVSWRMSYIDLEEIV